MKLKEMNLKRIVTIIFAIAAIAISGVLVINGDISYEEFRETTEEQVRIIDSNLTEDEWSE